MGRVLLAPFTIVIQTTGVGRLFAFVSVVVAFVVFLATLCYKFLAIISGHLHFFWEGVDSSLLSFIGYVLNFPFLYILFVFYYSIFCGFTISFIVTYSLELSFRFIPEVVDIFRSVIKTLTGAD